MDCFSIHYEAELCDASNEIISVQTVFTRGYKKCLPSAHILGLQKTLNKMIPRPWHVIIEYNTCTFPGVK